MNIRADLDQTVFVSGRHLTWRASPMAGVERVLLDRVGAELAVATSLVRYAPGSSFSEHRHDLGEEFVVLSGVFSDQYGDYPAGTYVRNPPRSSHCPTSAPGCVIFVKLRQFHMQDQNPVVTQMSPSPVCSEPQELYRYADEVVS